MLHKTTFKLVAWLAFMATGAVADPLENTLYISDQGNGNQLIVTQSDQSGHHLDLTMSGSALGQGATGLWHRPFGSDLMTADLLPGRIVQTGTQHRATVSLSGTGNLLSSLQDGTGHNLVVTVSGAMNQAMITQAGIGQMAQVNQAGERNSLSIRQGL